MSDEQEYKISQCDQDRRGAFGREGVPELSILFFGFLKKYTLYRHTPTATYDRSVYKCFTIPCIRNTNIHLFNQFAT